MNKEIEIPEGYEARIDGNKVIIELKESEDERIRKSLVKYFEKFNPKDMWDKMLSIGDVLAYFEKQKEQKPIDIDFVSDWLRKHTKTYVNSEYNEFHKTVEYDGSINIEHLIEDLKKAMEQQSFAHENDFVSKPAEWSEEDESYLQTVIGEMEASKKEALEYEHKIYDAIIFWLKSLPERFNLQPHWKPSEEQMEALSYVKEYFKDIPSAKKKYIFLVQLYDDIQKLL